MWRMLLDAVFPAQCAGCGAVGTAFCRECTSGAAAVNVSFGPLDVVASGWYEGTLRAAILAVKDGRRDVAESLGDRIAALVNCGHALVPVPTTAARLRVRGVDGVASIAATAGRIAGVPVLRVLRQRAGDAQRGRTRRERLEAHARFCCVGDVRGRSVTLVDDVCTTGATLTDCAAALRTRGASVKGAVVVAATKAQPLWESHARR